MQGPARSPGGPGSAPLPADLEGLERELQNLAHWHAHYRNEIEEGFARIRGIEDRFLALRPQADAPTQRELKRRMVLSRTWREELAQAYQSLLQAVHQIGIVTRRIHEVQLRAAQLASAPGGPNVGGPGSPPR
jgi:hypothetical protein